MASKSILLLFLMLITSPAAFSSGNGSIIVEISGFSESKGNAIVYLYSESAEDAYPTKSEKSMSMKKSAVKNKKCRIIFKDIPYGDYAIAVHHDENSNDEVDTNFIGIPTEDMGASNNAKGSFGPPSFEDAKFSFRSKEKTLKINMD